MMNYREKLKAVFDSEGAGILDRVLSVASAAVADGKSLVLYGAGKNGKCWLSFFENNKVNIDFVADGFKGGDQFEGYTVVSLEELAGNNCHGGGVVLFICPHMLNYDIAQKKEFIERCDALGINNRHFLSTAATWMLFSDKEFDKKGCLEVIEMLDDNLSKYSYCEYISSMLMERRFRAPYYGFEQQYIANDLFELKETDYIADCGAFIGDTVEIFARNYPYISGITAFEPAPDSFGKLEDAAKSAPLEVFPVNKAVGEKEGAVRFETFLSDMSSSRISDSDGEEIQICCLDDEMSSNLPTYIKMDLEGAELEALHGARSIISQTHPILAICIYHKKEDLSEIPIYIKELYSDYIFFVRKYGNDRQELVLYAVPQERCLC